MHRMILIWQMLDLLPRLRMLRALGLSSTMIEQLSILVEVDNRVQTEDVDAIRAIRYSAKTFPG
jgi:hypothetical protein